MAKEYYLYVGGQKVKVSEDIYKVYWREREHEKYLEQVDRKNHLLFFSSLDHDGHFVDNLVDESVDVEKIVETQMMIEAVRNAISKLNDEERDIIERLYFNDETLSSILYENKQIRSVWNAEKEEWYFSVVDVVGVLTESENPQVYWRVLKKRLKEEGNESVTNCNALKMKAADGKMRLTDVADMQGIFRIIQSIPSPKAEPFKLWLAEVGKERIDEIIDPELTIDRALETYLKKGYKREWINQRLQAIQVRKELTDAWDDAGIQKGIEYAILTDEITKAWSGMTTRRYKNLKGLKKENLRDNMTTLEIVLNMLAEATTTELTKATNPKGLEENKKVTKKGGSVAGNARKEIEKETGKPVITSKNAMDLSRLIEDVVKEPINKTEANKEKNK